jgi:hypothetical protein
MIHYCKLCGKEIFSPLDDDFVKEIKEHYRREHAVEVEVEFDWYCKVKSSTMPHKGIVRIFRVVIKGKKQNAATIEGGKNELCRTR